MPPKAILAGILIVGFFASLPLWLMGTPEQKQRMAHTMTTLKVVTDHAGLLNLQPAEQAHLRQMLKPPEKEPIYGFAQTVWQKDLEQVLKPWVHDAADAQTMAHWVYVYGQRFNLPPDLILSVISVESQFDRFAISHAGARGLMQIMPFWKNKLGSKDDNLFEIETNIRYGCAILRTYKNRYGKLSRALAAYNGSLGNTKYPARVYARMKTFKSSAADF